MAPCKQCNGYSFSRIINNDGTSASKYGDFCSFSCACTYSGIITQNLEKLRETNPELVEEVVVNTNSGGQLRYLRARTQ